MTPQPFIRSLTIILTVITFPGLSSGLAAEFSGSVIDGNTIEVLHNQRPERIRLSGIDCPEKVQAYGQKAKHAASDLAFGKEVTLQTHGHDKYKRTIGYVILPDGMNLNQELVKQGWCWWYRKYAPEDTVLEGLENEARAGRKGCGLILTRCRRGSGERGAAEAVYKMKLMAHQRTWNCR
jgi:hypothetical protein